MADRGSGTGGERNRLKTLAQAALNADVTVGQLEDVLNGLGDTMNALNSSLAGLNATVARLGDGLDHLDETMASLDDLAGRLVALIEPVETIVSRMDDIVSVGETAMAPLAATENMVRGMFNAMRNRVVR